MIYTEFCRVVRETRELWGKIWADHQAYGKKERPYLVINNIRYKYGISGGLEDNQITELDVITDDDPKILARYKWLGTVTRIQSFTIELRFYSVHRELVDSIRRHPLVPDIEGQKNGRNAGISITLYKYEGA